LAGLRRLKRKTRDQVLNGVRVGKEQEVKRRTNEMKL
jgi:hypothetical protein